MIWRTFVPTNVEMKRAMLIQNCQGCSAGVLKFSGVISNKAAAARSPTTAGRSPEKILCTKGVSMYFMNILLIKIIRMKEGSTRAKVAVALPKTAMIPLYPALCTAV